MPSSASDHFSPSEMDEAKSLHTPVRIAKELADTAAQIAGAQNAVDVDPAEVIRLRRKIDLHLMPLMCAVYLVQYADKATLGQSAVLGLFTSADLSQNQFNWLGTIFYLSFLVFEYPQNLALQRLPVGKWMSVCMLIWSIVLMCHAACTSFGGLFACRFVLGIFEGAITPGFMIVTSMFYTREEQTKRVGIWFLMDGVAIIVLGFISFGVIHTTTDNFKPWQWLMIITGICTFVLSILFWFLFPDSPLNARFLSAEEKVLAVNRIKVNQSGVENKHFKREQMIEALRDPKTWLFALFAGLSNVTNSISNQRQLIVKQFGFTLIQTTLLGCVDGVVEILYIILGVTLASIPRIGRAYAGVIVYVPALLGAILVNTLPSHNKIGLLFSYWLAIFAIVPFVNGLAWTALTSAGHTKRVTTNAMVVIGFALGNGVSPFMWKKQYQPRNHVPWAVSAACSVASAILLLVIRRVLSAENKRRDNERVDDKYDDVYMLELGPDGTTAERRVDKAFLDLTDRQNGAFRYVL